MSSSVAPGAVKIGDYIKLSILDDTSVVYSGKVLAIAKYPVARSMGSDIAARHEEVRSAITATGGTALDDITDQDFIILDTGESLPTVIAFQWIQGNSVEIIELGSTYMIKLLNCSKDLAEEAVAILRSNGISCKLNVLY